MARLSRRSSAPDESRVRTEPVPCWLCGSRRDRPFLSADNPRRGTTTRFAVVECLDCGFKFTNPAPTAESMRLYYPDDYEALVPERLGLSEKIYYRLFRGLGARAPGTLLDVGCGNGKYLYFMRERGWNCSGQDLGRVPAFVEKDFPIFRSELSAAPIPAASFDAITLWWSIEHMRDPLAQLKACRRLLKDGGRLAIATSNVDSVEARLFGRYWHHLDVPEHYSQFTPATLAAMVEKAGFRVRSLRHDALTFGFSRSLGHFLNARGLPGTAVSAAADFLFMPLDAAAALCRRGGLITLRAE
jgi:SAM-dependent methyltransferase